MIGKLFRCALVALGALIATAGAATAKVTIAIGGAGCLCYLPTVLAEQLGEFKKAGLDPHRHVVEIRNYGGLEQGQDLTAEIFKAGELVDVTSTSKGKGFQGLIKRHKFSRGPESHGSMNVRQPGAIGATDAARVFKGVRMSGQMGNERATARAYKVVRVDAERNLVMVKGGVPGAKGALVLIKESTKKVKTKGPAGKPNPRKV